MAGQGGCCEIQRLPEECLCQAISMTTPRDACTSEAVSASFRAAATSDDVWRRFLPPDYAEILSRAVDPVESDSMKQLYSNLCDPILIDGGKMSFCVDRETGGKCFMVPARELYIVWGETPHYWTWRHHPESRFMRDYTAVDEIVWDKLIS
ncbi:F-box protein [Platanthera guangdongensis]|uniref:F-box protein n=1 Tax=Platanthera guangdongensis TaxID=2320717 RepID=A0ABR2MA97_9ASPA